MTLQPASAGGGRVAVLSAGLAVLLVGLFAAVGRLADEQDTAASSLATPTALETTPPAATAPEVTPSRNPRREPDVDRGTPWDHGLFIDIADGWIKVSTYNSRIDLASPDRGAAMAFSVSSRPMPSRPLLRPDAEAFADTEQLYGLRAGQVRTLPPPNRNIVEAAAISFTGRRRADGATYSLTGECTRLRGAPETNDVSIGICWVAHVQDLDTVRPEVQRMLASVARSV